MPKNDRKMVDRTKTEEKWTESVNFNTFLNVSINFDRKTRNFRQKSREEDIG